jgi:hypothetical protein
MKCQKCNKETGTYYTCPYCRHVQCFECGFKLGCCEPQKIEEEKARQYEKQNPAPIRAGDEKGKVKSGQSACHACRGDE